MRNLLLIAKREYLEQVRGRAFRISTILLPLVFVVLVGVIYFANRSASVGKHLVVASSNVQLANEIASQLDADKYLRANVEVIAPIVPEDRAQLVRRVTHKEIDGFLWIESHAVGLPTATYESLSAGEMVTPKLLQDALNDSLLRERLNLRGVRDTEADALLARAPIETLQVSKTGEVMQSNAQTSFLKGYIMAFLLSMTTVMYGMNVARSIIQEKTSRIFEVMLSTARSSDLLAGKLIGVGAVGLTQIAIWGVGAAAFAGTALAAPLLSGRYALHLSWVEGVLFPVYFVLGYLLYSSLFAGLAATCETEQELQMYMPLAAVPVWLSFGLIVLVVNDPNSLLSVAASFFPPTAPIIMMLRLGSQRPPEWQFAVSLGLMALSVWGVLWFSTRLYRVGILMYGKRASLPELVRWLRYS